jgi:hypothetical protein
VLVDISVFFQRGFLRILQEKTGSLKSSRIIAASIPHSFRSLREGFLLRSFSIT